jgi:hypothetical protein
VGRKKYIHSVFESDCKYFEKYARCGKKNNGSNCSFDRDDVTCPKCWDDIKKHENLHGYLG